MKARVSVLVACLLLVFAAASSGATYYVATNGNDTTGDGSSGNPWATLQKAVNTMVAGDTTIVKNGTYAGFRATESKCGSPGALITIKAENTGQVTLNAKYSGAKHNGIIELEGHWDVENPVSYWDIEGFVLDGVNKTLMTLDTRWEDHNTFKNITAHHSSSRGLYISHGNNCLMENCIGYTNNEHGSYQANSCTNNTYRNNAVYSNASCGFHNNGDLSGGDPGLTQYSLYENNTSYSNPGASINCDGLELCMFRNNLAYNDGKGIALFQVDAAIASRNNNVYNNTLVMGTSSGYPVKIIGDTVAPVGNKVLNNILYHRSTANNRGSISIATNGFINFQSDYNVVMGPPNQFEIDDGGSYEDLTTWRNRGLDLHSITATESALFVNGPGNDYHLSSTSPARDAGTPLTSDVTTDKDGVSRPRDNGYDIGCYEYPGTVNPLSIVTSSLPGANTGVAYSQTLVASGGQTPYTWSLNSGSLPAGLSLASGGVISGTPTGTGTSNFTVKVTDSLSSTATKALSIGVTVLPVQITTPFLRNGWNGIHYSQKPQITGGLAPFTWSLLSGTLPTGTTLNTSTGEVSGSPSSNGTYNFTLRVADSQGSPSTAQIACSVTIGAASGTYYWVATSGSDSTGTGAWNSPWATLQHAADTVPGNSTILVEPGTYVGVQISWSGSSSSPDTFMSDTVRTAAINQPAAGNNHNSVFEIENYPNPISYWTVDGFVIDGANKSCNYGIDIRISDHMTVRNLEIHDCGATGLYMSFASYALLENNVSHNNGEHGSYQANQGTYNTYRKNVCYSNSGCGFHNNGDVSMGGTGKVDNSLYEKNVSHDNNGAGYNMDGVEVSTFKNNLSYNDHNKAMALFQGDAAINSRNDNVYNNTLIGPADSYYCVVIQAGTDNPVGNKLKNNVLYHYSTAADRGSICITTTGFTNFESDYNVVMSYFGINDNESQDTLTQWRARGYDTHSIQAADTALFVSPGTSDWHLKNGSPAANVGTTLSAVTDDLDGNSRPQGTGYDIGCYEYLSGGSPLSITTTSLPADTVSVAYNQTLAATGGTAPYTWSLLAGSLPAGLSLVASTGAITGTPTAAGTSNFTAKVTDNVSATATQALSIVVNATPSITTASLPANTVGIAYNQTLAASGGTSPLTWSLQSGSLPAGLSLVASTGAITGTPSASGASNFTAKVTDNVGATASKALSIVVNAAVTITTSSLPADTVGIAYNQALAATGGTGALTWSLNAGSLPAGLSLTSGGSITGTPTAAGAPSFTVKAVDTLSASATKALSITINAAPTITTSSLPADTINIAYNQTLSATGGTSPLTWAIASGSLPTGLSLVSGTGAITGTPTAAGTSSFTARVTDNVGATATKALSIAINPAVSITTASLPADTVGVAYNQTLAATGGTGALAWSISSGSLPAGLSIVAGTGAITGTPTTAGTSNFTAMATDTVGANGTKALSIVINAAISITTASLPADTVNIAYSQALAATGGTGALTWSLNAGNLPAGLSLTSGGSITGTPTAAGTSNFTVKATDTVTASTTKALSIVVNAAPSITTSSLPADTVGIAYNQTLASTGGTSPLSWSIQTGSLPVGLSLVAATGAITGTPTTAGTSNFTTLLTDNVGATATKALSIVVNAAPSITTSSLPNGSVSVAYNQTMAATGGTSPLTWAISSGSLPAGLSLTASTGAITGTPTASGTSNFTARVTDNVGATATKALSIIVTQGLTITTASLPADTVGVAYNQTLTASGGTTPYTWSISSGSLPAGLSLAAATGAITGTPTTAATSNFTAMVTDNVSATATKALSIVINAAVSITTASLPADTVNIAYNQTMTATGGTGALTWSISSGSLPAGLSLVAATGAITGTPTTAGASNFTAMATDTVGATGTKALSITINAAISITTSSLPADTVNIAYNQALAATGGTGSLTWSLNAGSLPAGLTLTSGGSITGTPTAAGTSNFTVRATDAVSATGTKALSIVINAAPSITTSSLPGGTVGTAYNQTMAATGGTAPLTWSIQSGSLPAGLSLVASTGAITGTPTASGTSNFTAKVTDNVTASATKALSIVVTGGGGGPYTYYVSTTGNDTTGDGSSGNPWATIQKGVDTAANGDTIIVTNGSYAGFRARYSGASGAVKTVKAQNALGAVITSAGAQCTTPSYIEVKNDTPANDVSYWVIDGFETTGSANYGIEIQYGDHVTVKNCKAHNSTQASFSMHFSNYCTLQSNETYSSSASGFYVGNSGDNCSIVSNSSHNNASNGMLITSDTAGGDMKESSWLIEKNTMYANANTMTCDGLETSTLRNNLGYGSTTRSLRFLGSEASITCANNRILNNTFLQNGTGYYTINIHRVTAGLPEGVGNQIFNNILYNYDSAKGSITVDTAAETNFASDYNVVMNVFGLDDGATTYDLTGWRGLGYDTHSIQATDTALFVNPGTDYHLKAGSPAINAGTTLADVADDKEGTTRPQGGAYDIGCYEVVPGAEPTYQFAASDSEATTTSTNYTNKATLSFTPGISDTWVIMGFAELKNSSTSRLTSAQLTIDGAVAQDTTLAPKNNTDYQSFVGMKAVTLSAAAHTINIDYKTSASAGTAYIRYARIVAIRQASLLINTADEGDTGHDVTTTMTDYVTTTFTPATGGDYLLIWSTAMNGNTTSYNTNIEARLNGTAQDTCSVRNNNTSNYVTFLSVQMANLAASSQTISLAASKASGSSATHHVKRSRVTAIRLSGSRFTGYQSNSADSESTTTSTTFQNKLTKSWTPSAAGNWLVLTSFRITNSSTSYSTEGQVTVDDSTTSAQPLKRIQATTDYLPMGSVDVRNLTAAAHHMDVNYRSANASGTAKIKYVRFVGLPL